MIKISDLYYSYPQSEFELKIKKLFINSGEAVAITGQSGSGKSTLLKIISGEIQIKNSKVEVLNNDLSKMSNSSLRDFRLQNIGLFSQNFTLLDYLSVEENILLLKQLSSKVRLNEQWQALCEKCGIEKYLKKYPPQLSEGEKQRVALCRAFATTAKLILADEPTSSLDQNNSETVTELMIQNCKDLDRTLVMVTHDTSLLKHFDRVIDLVSLGGS